MSHIDIDQIRGQHERIRARAIQLKKDLMQQEQSESEKLRLTIDQNAFEEKQLRRAHNQSVHEKQTQLFRTQRQIAVTNAFIDYDEDQLQLAIQLSLLTASNSTHGISDEYLEARKRREEELTTNVLGAITPFQPEANTNADSTITISGKRYRRKECGSSHGEHTNLCFYMSVMGGNGADAVDLKKAIAPAATELSRMIGANTDFTRLSALADTEVIRAYVLRQKVSVVVYNSRAGVATSYQSDADHYGCVHLHNDGGHFQLLIAV